MDIAIAVGFKRGARLPGTVYGPLYFADQDWKKPDREAYMKALAKHKPHMATVLDWEKEEQLDEVLSWAEEAAQYAEKVLIIPKVSWSGGQLPRNIGGKQVVLGFSVPTRYGGTPIPFWEFAGWPVHLLGGSPQRQMEYWRYLTNLAEVISIDGNMANKMATRHCQFWTPGNARYAQNRYWPTLKEACGEKMWEGENATHEAFRRSCENIWALWHPAYQPGRR